MFSNGTRRISPTLLIASMLVLPTQAAWAQANKAQAKAHAGRAAKSFKSGKYEAALREFTRANKLFPAPAFLFNIAQCHIFLGNHDRAIFFLERYLNEAPDSPHRSDVLALVEESRREIEKKSPKRQAGKGPAKTLRAGAEDSENSDLEAPGEDERSPPQATGGVAPPNVDASPPRAELTLDPSLSPAAAASHPTSPSPRDDVVSASLEKPRDDSPPLLGAWWFWTIVGGVAVAAGGTAIALSSGGETRTILPSGSLGVADRRTLP